MLTVVGEAVATGLFWGTIVAAVVRWTGRGLPGTARRAFKWFVGTALVLGLAFPLIHPHGF